MCTNAHIYTIVFCIKLQYLYEKKNKKKKKQYILFKKRSYLSNYRISNYTTESPPKIMLTYKKLLE